MIELTKTEESVRRLLNLLRCDGCNATLHLPYTTGLCAHTLCDSCSMGRKLGLSKTGSCPVCLIPVRPCDVKPHPQLSSLVLLARRLAKLLKMPGTFESSVPLPDLQPKIHLMKVEHSNMVNTDSAQFIDRNCDSSNNLECFLMPNVEYIDMVDKPPQQGLYNISRDSTVSGSVENQSTHQGGSKRLCREAHSVKTSWTTLLNIQNDQSKPLLNDEQNSKLAPLTSMEDSCLNDMPVGTHAKSEQMSLDASKRRSHKLSGSRIAKFPPATRKAPNTRASLKKGSLEVALLPHTRSENLAQSPDQPRRNVKGETALHQAAIRNDVARIKELLSAGHSPNIQDNAGWTPLHEAALRGHVEVARCLIAGNALVDVPGGSDLETALHDAVLNLHLACCQLLLRHGANPHLQNRLGVSPLRAIDTLTATKFHSRELPPVVQAIRRCLQEAALHCRRNISSCGDITETRDTASGGAKTKTSTCLSMGLLFVEKRRLHPVLLCTGLDRIQRALFTRVASLIHARVVQDMSSDVTHLITGSLLSTGNPQSPQITAPQHAERGDESDTGLVTCPRTIEFLFAILQGCWILSFDWVTTCSYVGVRVEEGGFEVSGCSRAPTSGSARRARLAREAGSPRLFQGLPFCLVGTFEYPTPERSQLSSLASTAGAIVSQQDVTSAVQLAGFAVECNPSEWRLSTGTRHTSRQASACFEISTEIQACQLIVIYDPGSRVDTLCPKVLVKSAINLLQPINTASCPSPAPILLAPASWFLDCITEYSILPMPSVNI